jgi:hypothetical protein
MWEEVGNRAATRGPDRRRDRFRVENLDSVSLNNFELSSGDV